MSAASEWVLKRVLRYQRTAGAYRRMFGNLEDPDTAAVLADLAQTLNHHRTSVRRAATVGAVDPLALAFEEGKREAFLYIVKRANQSPAAVDRAIQREMKNAA